MNRQPTRTTRFRPVLLALGMAALLLAAIPLQAMGDPSVQRPEPKRIICLPTLPNVPTIVDGVLPRDRTQQQQISLQRVVNTLRNCFVPCADLTDPDCVPCPHTTGAPCGVGLQPCPPGGTGTNGVCLARCPLGQFGIGPACLNYACPPYCDPSDFLPENIPDPTDDIPNPLDYIPPVPNPLDYVPPIPNPFDYIPPPPPIGPTELCPPGSVGVRPNCVPTSTSEDCPTLAGLTCPPTRIPSAPAALVEFFGDDAMVAVPAFGAPGFTVFVSGLPPGVASVEIYGEGRLLGDAAVEMEMADGALTSGGSVRFDNVPLLESNTYNVVFVDASNSNTFESSSLPLWTDVRRYITDPTAAPATDPEPAAPSEPDESSPEAPPSQPNCAADSGTTWANELPSPSGGVKTSNHGNEMSYDEIHLTDLAFVSEWEWGAVSGCGAQNHDHLFWGFSDGHQGPSLMKGFGKRSFYFGLTYGGGGRTSERMCRGGTCQWVGYEMLTSNARSFMRTPNQGQPSFEGVSHVSVPTHSGPPPSWWAQLVLAGLEEAIDHWSSTFVKIVGLFFPDEMVDMANRNWKELITGLDGSKGGGLLVRAPAAYGKTATGEMEWRFNGEGDFSWQLEAAAEMTVFFSGCYGCSTFESGSTLSGVATHRIIILKNDDQ